MIQERILGNNEWPEIGMVLRVETSTLVSESVFVGPVFHIVKMPTATGFNGYIQLKPNLTIYHEQSPEPHWVLDDRRWSSTNDKIKIVIIGYKHPIDM